MTISHRLQKAVWFFATAAGVFWLLGVVSVFKLVSSWKLEIPLEITADRWWTDGIGNVHVSGLRLFEMGAEKPLIEGNLTARFSPWDVWLKDRRRIQIQGTKIFSKYVKEIMPAGDLVDSGIVRSFDVDLVLDSDGSLVVERARAEGPWGAGTLTGSVDRSGILDLESKWTLNHKVTKSIPGVFNPTVPTPEGEAAATTDPTVIQCFLQGSIEHPSIRLSSEYFQVELG